jgi:hypothetical protein
MTDSAIPALDKRLWIVVDGVEGTSYLLGNSHTFPGRMRACNKDVGTFSVSKGQITDCSPDAENWISAYLNGNEPPFGEAFGHYDGPLFEARYARWLKAVATFRSSGEWHMQPYHQMTSFEAETRLPNFVWTIIGDEVWRWRENRWNLVEPTPPHKGRLLEGSVCAAREHHNMAEADSSHLVCTDCGWTSEVDPDGS